MNHQHDQDRAHAHDAPQHQNDADHEPTRRTKSSQLAAPATPIASGLVQRKADHDGVSDNADAALAATSGSPGMALPGDLQSRFESSLGADLGGVRVHTGSASASAAAAFGARAFATGNDIHFAAGQYDPSSHDGQKLLAHEVAHTVQQGSSHKVQHKLEVSSPHDAAEHEADRAAEAMVAGTSFAVSMGSGIQRKVFRKEDAKLTDKDKQTAQAIQRCIRDMRATVQRARTTLNADAAAASSSIDATRSIYKEYESRYKSAVIRFTEGVTEAQKNREQLDKALGITADLALKATGAFGGVAAEAKEMYEGVRKAQEAMETAKGFLSAEGNAKPPPVPTDAGGKGDWEGLLNTLSATFKDYTKLNQALTAIDQKCNDDDWVNSVANGTLDPVPKNVWSTEQGVAAQRLANGGTQVIQQLSSIAPGVLSTKPKAFLEKVQGSLPGKSGEDLEKDVAIRWLAGLSLNDLKAIKGAASYLAKIGLIDKDGNTLGVTSGLLGGLLGPSKFAQMLILARAKVEQRARELVGQVVYWTFKGGGCIEDPDDGTRYTAHGTIDPAGNKDSQRVQITGYNMKNRITQLGAYTATDDGEKDPVGVVKGDVTFEFVPYKSGG